MSTFFKEYFAQFDLDSLLKTLLSKGLSLLILYLLFLLIKKIIKISVKRILKPSLQISRSETSRQKTIMRLVENILNYCLYFIVIYSVLSILGLPVSSLIAGAGITGVVIGLGAQGFLSDLVNGFFILLEHQFDVGDSVRLTNGSITVSGSIVSVGIRTTQVRDWDGTLHFIPNRNILVVSNQSRGDMRAQVDIPLYITTDLGKVAAVIEAVNQREVPLHKEIKEVKVLGPQTTTNGQFSYRINFYVDSGQQSKIYHDFYGLYQEALLQEGIDMPTASVLL